MSILSNNMEDNALIDRFLKGDKTCFDELVVRYKGMVFNVCLRMLRDYNEALDVSQDIFLKVYDSLKNFRGESKFSTYLYRITMNFCKNKLKAMARLRKREAVSLDDPIETSEGQMKRQIAADTPTPREMLNAKEKRERILAAVNSLKHEHKEIIILREIQGLNYEDIAEALEIDIGTVKSRLSRARLNLKDKLKGIL